VDGDEYELTIPSRKIIVNVVFDVTEDDTVELTLDFDAENSIQPILHLLSITLLQGSSHKTHLMSLLL